MPDIASMSPEKGGRNPDPQGGRMFTCSFKLNAYEAQTLHKDKVALEKEKGRVLTDSEYLRHRLLNGGSELPVNYPPLPLDNRRERRGSVPRTRRKAAELSGTKTASL